MRDPLHIFQVAIVHEGSIYSMDRPHRHHHIIRRIVEITGASYVHGDQGFIDPRSGKFMDRKEAAIYAWAVGQINRPKWKEGLFSEDLW